jgi:hypothetical protein
MFILDDNNTLVDSEFSLDLLDDSPCVIVESSGGANPSRGVTRRNPDYNKLVGLLLQRLAVTNTRITAVVLDSSRVAHVPVTDRTATFDQPYPIDLSTVDIDEFRRTLGRAIAMMHRAPDAKAGGNAQKRIRLCIDRAITPEELDIRPGNNDHIVDDHAPGLTETEKTYLQKARVGQGQFRKLLLDAFQSTCPLLGISNPDVLVASHIKPWKACTNQERLDPNNGILLSPLFDRLFDRGLVTFTADGTIEPSPCLSPDDRAKCQLAQLPSITLPTESDRYMMYHRRYVYKCT